MPAEFLELPWPIRGQSEGAAFGKQPALTTRQARNVRSIDPVTGRRRGSKRSGRTNYVAGQANGATKIKRLQPLVYDKKGVTYALIAAGSEEQAWTSSNPTTTDCLGVQADSQSNVYVLDGPSGAAKYNSENALIFKISFPVADLKHTIRAFYVDDFTGIYAGVSSGGDQKTAKLWKYRQTQDNKAEVVWTLSPGAYVEAVKRKDSLLYALLNYADKAKAYVVVYEGIDSDSPSEVMRWEVPYPANDMDLGPKDGSVFVASEPNSRRGLDPASPFTTARWVEWTPLNLTDWQKRIWCWLDASDLETLAIVPPTNTEEIEGGEVKIWFDKSGNSRNLTAPTASGTGPSYRSTGFGAMPSLRFNGTDQWLTSATPSSIDRALRDQQKTLIPTYREAAYCI
ncbi:MAG TPA: hypothetical protein VEJ18_20625, partial [Planctomycetota bacterium]|nr:hypothetical protein [Planctomycetota bacterium]